MTPPGLQIYVWPRLTLTLISDFLAPKVDRFMLLPVYCSANTLDLINVVTIHHAR